MDTKNSVNDAYPNVQILQASPEAYEKAAQAIRDGKIVVMPTLTIYVVVCDAFNASALRRLREIRHSPAVSPLQYHNLKPTRQHNIRLKTCCLKPYLNLTCFFMVATPIFAMIPATPFLMGFTRVG
ncbi:L-threonylcarbamoyladenylate synthase [Acetobacterium malicum]|uniref:L-threonylcarbamoyladenylate synthase n=1 Tax=Acetobacterium malicum TaxID=52692 RepID=UPI0009FDA127|nr:Sua5/YciO/YrdC/YwlC family protein [Acetobacterium dehalogenans]